MMQPGRWCLDGDVPSYVGPAPANFTWDPDQLRAALAGRRIVLIGDSLTMQWARSLSCYLSGTLDLEGWSDASSPEWKAIAGKVQKLRAEPYALPTQEDAHKTFKFHRLRLPDVRGEIVTYVSHLFWPRIAEGLLALHARDADEKADLVVINQGTHFNDPSLTNGPESLREDLVGYMELCKAEGLHCILRESSAQHFWYEGSGPLSGLFRGGPPRVCISSKYNESEEFYHDVKAQWRRDELVVALDQVGQRESVMPVFEATMPLTFAHPNKGDCTHFALNTEIWEPWHAALFGLLEGMPPKHPNERN